MASATPKQQNCPAAAATDAEQAASGQERIRLHAPPSLAVQPDKKPAEEMMAKLSDAARRISRSQSMQQIEGLVALQTPLRPTYNEAAVTDPLNTRLLAPQKALAALGVAEKKFTGAELVEALIQAGLVVRVRDRLSARERWRRALKPAIKLGAAAADPWREHEIHKLHTELCTRWDYIAASDEWVRSETMLKMQLEPFAKGAMRECYRMKKMSQVTASFFWRMDWQHCNNYVAKRYIKPEVTPDTYFADVKMQMVAKRYSKLYNALQPPKQVDFLQAFVIELRRNGRVLHFCVEKYVTGEYVKHNNNAGHLDFDGAHRATPHAFSRFTFEASLGKLMIVDIQGVDDIFTDPQIHSADGEGYGDGNLGVGGMALFFSTSHYDELCEALGLRKFALSDRERLRILAQSRAASEIPSAKSSRLNMGTVVSLGTVSPHSLSANHALSLSAADMCAAAAAGDVRKLRLVVQADKDVNEAPYDGRTALHVAAAEGHEEVVAFLLDAKADVERVDRWGATALDDAVRGGHMGAVELLQKRGAHQNPGALHNGALRGMELCGAAARGDVDAIALLLEEGLDPNQRDYDKRTALHLAAAEGRLAVVRYLVEEAGVERAPEDRWGRTPYEEALRAGHKAVAAYLDDDNIAAKASVAFELRKTRVRMGAVDETQLRAADLPLHLLMNDETAEEAREEAGLPKLAITAPPPLPLPAVHVRARVHAKLSEFSQSGVLPLQKGEADLLSAGFHLVCAAAAGEPRALRDMRALLLGLASDEVLPGVKLEPADVADAAQTLMKPVVRRLAAAGDVDAMRQVALGGSFLHSWLVRAYHRKRMLAICEEVASEGDLQLATTWLSTAVEIAQSTSKDHFTCEMHHLYSKLAELQAQAGDNEAAAESFQAASDAANDDGHYKIGLKYAERAAALSL